MAYIEKVINDIRSNLADLLPPEAKIVHVEFEGPFLVLYSQAPDLLLKSGQTIKNLAKTLRKRIVIRSDVKVRLPKEEADKLIREIVPEEALISSVEFDDLLGECIIEAKKPGLVIGESGKTLREISKTVFWRPTVVRTLPMKSTIISSIRGIYSKDSLVRKRELENMGLRIHRPQVYQSDIVRATMLGGGSEIGRSCLFLETAESKVLIDCGMGVGSTDPNRVYPFLNASEFSIEDLDAVIVSHAHLDHCLLPDTPILMADGAWKQINGIKEGDLVISMNWKTGKLETSSCVGKTKSNGHKTILKIRTPYLNIATSPNHRFFTAKNLKICEVEAQYLRKDDLIPVQKFYTNPISFKNQRKSILENEIEREDITKINQEIREEFRENRLKRKLTLKIVANKINIREETISKAETRGENISFSLMKKLLNFYGIAFNEFINRHHLPCLPKELTPELAQLVGYIQGDGTISAGNVFKLVETDLDVIKKYSSIIEKNFRSVHYVRRRKDTITPTYTIELNNPRILKFLQINFESIFSKSRDIKLPEKIRESDDEILIGYLRGIFDAEGSTSPDVKVTTFSDILLFEIQNILYRLGIASSLDEKEHSLMIKSYRSKKKFHDVIGFSASKKSKTLFNQLKSSEETNYRHQDRVPISSNDLKIILEKSGLIGRIHNSPNLSDLPSNILDWYRRGSGYSTRETVLDLIQILENRVNSLKNYGTQIPKNLLPMTQNLSTPRTEISLSNGLYVRQIQYREETSCQNEKSESLIQCLENLLINTISYIEQTIQEIHSILKLDVEWQPITKIKKEINSSSLLDIEVYPNQNFVANSIIVHNSGMVPYLYKHGFRGPVYCNDATLSLMTLLQKDYIEKSMAEDTILPYTQKDIVNTILHTIGRRYSEVTDISPDVRLTLSPAGHILGSAIIHLHIGNGKFNLAIANDFKFAKTRLLAPANHRFPRLEALIMESTYGGNRDNFPSRRETELDLIKIINDTIRRRGKVLIPTIAVGKAQEIMVILDHYFRRKDIIQQVPVYLDGLIHEASAIYCTFPEYLSTELQNAIFSSGNNPFQAEYFIPLNKSRSNEISQSGPCIILATSEMLTGGPSVEYFHRLASDDRNSIIFVSQQADKTLGKRILQGVREIRYFHGGKAGMTQVKIQVHNLEGLSGHSDRNQLLSYVRKLSPRPKQIILNHGLSRKSNSLKDSLSQKLRIQASVLQNLETIRFN